MRIGYLPAFSNSGFATKLQQTIFVGQFDTESATNGLETVTSRAKRVTTTLKSVTKSSTPQRQVARSKTKYVVASNAHRDYR